MESSSQATDLGGSGRSTTKKHVVTFSRNSEWRKYVFILQVSLSVSTRTECIKKLKLGFPVFYIFLSVVKIEV